MRFGVGPRKNADGDEVEASHSPHSKGMDKGKAKINLKTSFIEARDWPKFRFGYFQLLKYLIFVALYFAILIVQMKVDDVFLIDEALRQTVVDEGGSLQGVESLGDFFNYLSDQIMPNVFPDAWYNDKPLSTAKDEVGYVLGYNKLVGGLLITQKRRIVRPYCKQPAYPNFRSSYEDFYPTCFGDAGIETFVTEEQRKEFPIGTKRDSPDMKWSADPGWLTMVPWTLKVVKNPATNRSTVEVLEPTPPQVVNDSRSDPKTSDYYSAFTYTIPSNTAPPQSGTGYWNEASYSLKQPQLSDGAFRAFLKLSDGATFNERKLEFLKDNLWLDKFTSEVSIKFAVYNGMLSMFTFVSIRFGYSTTGTFLPFNTKGGTMVTIKSINMEPYRMTQRSNCTSGWTAGKNASCYEKFANKPDKLFTCNECVKGVVMDEVQLALEVVFMIWLFYDIVSLMRRGLSHAMVGWNDYQDPVLDDEVHLGFKSFITDAWTFLDMINYALFLMFIVIRVSLITMILNKDNAVKVPINDYVVSLEYAASIMKQQLFYNFINIVLCLVRTFKFYRFQPRLAIVNQTLAAAHQDLVHFLLMFMTFVLGFSVIAHILFGPEMHIFSTVPEAVNSIYIMMLTAGVDVASMSHIDGTMAVLFYNLFMLLVAVILLNVLLAILVDSYMKAKEEELERWAELGYDELPNMIDQLFSYQTLRHLFVFTAIHEDLLLETLRKLKSDKEEEHGGTSLYEMNAEQLVVTVQDIFDAIPVKVRVRARVTIDRIYSSNYLQWAVEDEKIEEEDDLGNLHEAAIPLDATEETLYQRIQELIQENEMLHMQHGKHVASGRLKSKHH